MGEVNYSPGCNLLKSQGNARFLPVGRGISQSSLGVWLKSSPPTSFPPCIQQLPEGSSRANKFPV